MELKEIVKKYLIDNGFSGLFNQDIECGCDLENLMCCNEPNPFCEPGYKRKPNKNEESDWDWVIVPNKTT